MEDEAKKQLCSTFGKRFQKYYKAAFLKRMIGKLIEALLPPTNKHKVGKDLTFYIEGFNAAIRARVSRLVRKSRSFSKSDTWHNLAIGWFFWQFNLERQLYI